ncbi:MAG: hypothetical protein KKD73_01170 [Proteobacteria bacterium]|nr:hypothetical protein [Pseudomonadota bacterium]MBU1641108.1 hypothetical protein [Pseudomonadota bacterium]
MKLHTCVRPGGRFSFVIHKPSYRVTNLRQNDEIIELGLCQEEPVFNSRNFPADDLEVEKSDWVYEIANPFSFKGTTFINSAWADRQAETPLGIRLTEAEPVSMADALRRCVSDSEIDDIFLALPTPVLLSLATTSTDPEDLMRLARQAASFIISATGEVDGLRYEHHNGRCRAIIHNHDLYEAVANNPHLPDDYKQAMVLRPGAQGGSEIIGEFRSDGSHVFEYLRRNSYIPWGHYAANMANDAVRYSLADLRLDDMIGMRHLYYQRTYDRLAVDLGLAGFKRRRTATAAELEATRQQIVTALAQGALPSFSATLWGWNYGFDFAASGYRLNASHQMLHQQFALIPTAVSDNAISQSSFACGDLIASFSQQYQAETGNGFFSDYIAAIHANSRMDGRKAEKSLIIHEDEHVMVFVPKAQTSQWEVQIMTTEPVGNILELSTAARHSLDMAFYLAAKALHGIGVKLMCSIEYSKRFTSKDHDQRLFYALLPKLPKSPGAFSESQLRWINGHFPEDLATALRASMPAKSTVTKE